MSTGVVIRLKNLPVSAGTIDIRRFFSTLSIPDGGVHIIGGEDGTAFILFTTDEDARQAMLRDSQKIVGEKIKLMLSSHTEMRLMIEESQRRYEELRGLRPPEPPITNLTSRSSATGGGAQKSQPENTEPAVDLYCEMKGMPYNVSEEDIVEFFQSLPISAIRFMRDEKGRQSGQGFVKFKTASGKQQALKKDRDFLGPRFVRVITATERQWLLAGSQMCDTVRPSNDEFSNRKRGQNSTPTNEGTPKRSRALSPIRCDNCVELRGLPVTSTYKTVQDLFYHLKFVDGGLFLEMDGKHCRGRAFAEFGSMDDFKEALLKDGEMLEGKQIRVISISRQVMAEQIKQHKKYMKMKREEEYKREREEIERKEREKLKERQMKEAQEEQKRRDEEDQKKRREYQMKKQREMEEWLARQHAKEEEERKRRELERLLEQRRIQEEEERARRNAERAAMEEKRRREEDELRRKEEAEMRAEFERKRQIELQRLEAKIKEEAEMRIKQEFMKKERESMNQNGNIKEVEMDLEDQNPSPVVPKEEYSEDYPPPPSDALPVKPASSQFSTASSDSGFSQYSKGSSGAPQVRSSEPSSFTPHSSSVPPPYQSMAYQHRFTPPPPLPSPGASLGGPNVTLPPPTAVIAAPSVAPLTPLKLPPAPAVIIAATPPPHLVTNLPPPPLPPTLALRPVVPLPGAPDAVFPPRISVPSQVPPGVQPSIQPPPVTIAPPSAAPPAPTSTAPTSKPPPSQPKPPHPNDPNIPSKFVRIANSPFTISEHMIRDFFRGLPIAPHGVQFVMKNNKRSGHIFIKFMYEEDAERASRQDKGYLGGREVLVQKTNPTQMTQLLRKYESRNLEDLFPLSDFVGIVTSSYKPPPPPTSMSGPPPPQRDGLNLEMSILADKLTCVRLGSVPPHTIPEDIMRTFTGISIMPNGIHILHTPDGKCNGNAFVELVTPEDCVRATNLHAIAEIQGSLIRVMPVRNVEMDKEITDHNMKTFGRPPPGPPMPSNLPPPHPDDLRMRLPPPGLPDMPRGPMDILGPRLPPPPPRMSEYDLAMRHHPPIDGRDPLRPPLPPMEPPRPRGRSPTPPHMNMHRPPSPRNMPPMRPRSPPRGSSPGRPMGRRSPSPSMRLPPRDMSREEMEHRAEMDELNRRIDHERAMLRERDLDHRRPPPFDIRPPFPAGPGGPRFDRPPFPGDGPRFPPGMPPPRFMGDGPMRPRLPMDMPPFRMPMQGLFPVKMSNLSFQITQEDILEFFMKYSPLPDSVRLMYNPMGKLTGEGLIAFTNRDAAEAAIKELNQKMLLNRKVRLCSA